MKRLLALLISLFVLVPAAPAQAASDPDLCNWIPTDRPQETVRTRLDTEKVINLAPGFCTSPGQEVLRAFVRDEWAYLVKWRHPADNYSGQRWVTGPYILQLVYNGFKVRVLDAAKDSGR